MSIRDVVMVALSVVVATCASLWASFRWRPSAVEHLRVRSIEIVDERGRLRGRIGMAQVGGRQLPQLVLLDEKGKDSVFLTLNARGEGTLFFSSADREGKVGVGYLSGSDVTSSAGELTDERNTLGAWGVRVLGPDFQTISLGFGDAGQRFAPTQ
jgi:hypothetical protein